jgi:hypothetical protein
MPRHHRPARHTSRTHHSSTLALGVPDRPRLEAHHCSVFPPRTTRQYNERLARPPLRHRQRFFLLNKGKQFVEFDRFSGGRCGRSVRDGLGSRIDPIDDGLVMNIEEASNATEVESINVHTMGRGFEVIGIATWFGIWCVAAVAQATAVAL